MSEQRSERTRISLTSKIRYIYALIDPRDDTVRYVGMTRNVYYRLEQHLHHSSTNGDKTVWINELKQQGLSPEMEILEAMDNVPNIDLVAQGRELYWIQHFLEVGAPLLNVSSTPRAHPPRTIKPRVPSSEDTVLQNTASRDIIRRFKETKEAISEHAYANSMTLFAYTRLQAKLTIKQLAEEAKVSTSFIYNMEESNKPVKIELAVRVCRVLSRHLSYDVTYQSLKVKVRGLNESV